MKRLFPVVTLLASLVLVGSANLAHAQGGINIAWTDCGAAGQIDRVFACTSNSGTNLMVGSFDPPVQQNGFLSIEAVVDIISQSATLTDWWKVKNPPGKTGYCRNGSLVASSDFTGGPFTCTDVFAGAASGGVTFLNPFPSDPTTTVGSAADSLRWARMKVVFAVPSANAAVITPGTEYYAFKLTINNAKTVGTGACAGCADPVCIVLNMIRLVQALGAPGGDQDVSAVRSGGTNIITWQGGPGSTTCNLVPARRATWGQIKSLYR